MQADAFGRRWPAYGAVWRWHFYAGMLCIPFVLWLSVTGSIFLFKPQVEAWIDRPYAHVATGGPRASAADQVRAAERAVPGAILRSYQLPEALDQAVQIVVTRGAAATRVYVHPQSLAILKTADEDGRPMAIVQRLHGELLIGDIGSYLVELAASWAVVMILSGLFLWWPRGRGPAGVVYPRLGARGRPFLRDLHAVTGFWVSVFALGFLFSGLPWAKSWGGQLRTVRAYAASVGTPATDWSVSHSDDVKQRARQDAAMRAGGDEHAAHHGMAMAMGSPVDYAPLDRLIARVAPLGLASPVILAPPAGMGQPWMAKSETANRPQRVEIALDPATGAELSRSEFAGKPLINRAVDYGVAGHEGQLFGWANQLLNLIVAIGLFILAATGALMWWRRKPLNVLGAPPARDWPPVAIGFVASLVVLGLILPLLGLSMIAVLLIERLVLRHLPGPGRWLGLRPTPVAG